MRTLRRVLLLVITIIFLLFTLCSCAFDYEYVPLNYKGKNNNDKLPFVNGNIPNMMHTATTFERYINESYFEEYPCIDGYYGYAAEGYHKEITISALGYNIKIRPLLGSGADERLFVYLQYDGETYQKAKEYLIEVGGVNLSESPIEEYNGYVFYHGFGSDKEDNNFGNFVYNDSNNTIILLAFFYHEPEENNTLGLSYDSETVSYHLKDCVWHEHIEMLFGRWYDFSA